MRQFIIAFLLIVFFSLKAHPQEFVPIHKEKEEDYRIKTLDYDAKVEVVSKKEETAAAALGVVSIINRREIELFGATNLGEVLDRIATTYLTGTVFYPGNMLSIRGDVGRHFNSRVLILINGRPANGSSTNGIDWPLFRAFPLETIERIEVSRGPGSVYHGSGAFTGVVNVVTRRSTEKTEAVLQTGFSSQSGVFASGSAGHTHLGSSADTNKNDRISVFGGFKFFEDDGWDAQLVSPLRENISYNLYDRSVGFFGDAFYKGLSVNTFAARSRIPSVSEFNMWLPDTRAQELEADLLFINAGYSKSFYENWRTDVNITYVNINGSRENELALDSSDIIGEATISGRLSNKMSFTFGAEVRNETGGKSNTSILSDYNELNYRGYLDVVYDYNEYLSFLVGLQRENFDAELSGFYPKIGLRFYILPGVSLKAMYSNAYRNPSRVEKEIIVDRTVTSPILPETAKSFEGQVIGEFRTFYFSAAYFRTRFSDQIVPVFGEGQFTNDQFEIMSSGFEFESKVAMFPNFYLTGSFSVFENRRETEDPKLFVIGYTSSPDFFLKTGISYFIPDKFSVGVFSSYYNTPAPIDVTGWQDDVNPLPNAFTWVTANACYSFADWIKVKLYIKNLLDQDVYFPDYGLNSVNSIPGRTDRAFFLSTVINFGR